MPSRRFHSRQKRKSFAPHVSVPNRRRIAPKDAKLPPLKLSAYAAAPGDTRGSTARLRGCTMRTSVGVFQANVLGTCSFVSDHQAR